MSERALNISPRSKKGPVISPPALHGDLLAVAEAVSSWPGVITTGHWSLFRPRVVDGIDFYVGEEELGHIHLDGDLHLATTPSLGSAMIAERLARRFPYNEGWVHEHVQVIGAEAATALFRRNYDRIFAAS